MTIRSAHVSSVFISLLLIACCATAVVAAPVASNAAAASSELLHLYPETPRVAERLRCGLTQRYRVHDLEPTKVYDVKVSYPASIPTDFILEVDQVLLPAEDPAGNAAAAGTMRVRRLNTAKLRLHPQELLLNALRKNHHDQDQRASNTYRLDLLNGRAKATMNGQQAQALALERVTLDISLRAQVEGVSPVIDPSTRECVFDIVVEEMLFGAFPYDTLVLIVWLALLLLVALKGMYPYLLRKIALELPEERVYLGSSGSGGNIKES